MLYSVFICLSLCQRRGVLLVIGLIAGCAGKFVVSSILLFNLYQGTIKEMFNYTQTQVELLGSMFYAGSVACFVPGIFYDRFGSELTLVAGLVITVGANMLIWISAKYVQFYSSNHWLMMVYFCMAGFGTVFTYVTTMTTNIINFEYRHAGKIVGILNSSYFIGGFVGMIIFYTFFTNKTGTEAIGKFSAEDGSKYDFPGIILFEAITCCIIHVFCIFFLRTYEDVPTCDVLSNTNDSGNKHTNVAKNDNKIHQDTTDKAGVGKDEESRLVNKPCAAYTTEESTISSEQMSQSLSNSPLSLMGILSALDFQLASMSVALSLAVVYSYNSNITVISESAYLNTYDERLTGTLHIINAVCSASCGYVSDKLKEKLGIPRIVVLIAGIVCIELGQVFVLLFADKLILFEIATALHGIGHSINLTLGPLLINEMFFEGNLGRNLGIIFTVSGLLLIAIQSAVGVLYDIQAHLADSSVCYGMHCIRGGMIVSSLCVFLSLGFAVALYAKTKSAIS